MKIKSRTWNLIVIVGSIALVAIGFGGLFLLQSSRASATVTSWLIIVLGILTFLFFAGPGIAFSARKRIPWLKAKLPGGTLAWVRAHLYLPILALVAAYVHASSAPFRSLLTSGKVLLGIAIVVSLAGVARHHLIGVTKSAVNADAQISKIAAAQSRQFRQLVIDYKQLRRPLADINADAATLTEGERAAWGKVLEAQTAIDQDFPRGGGQSRNVRALKLLRAVHAPLTIVLFAALGFHIADVVGFTDTVLKDETQSIASNADCAGCHQDIADDFNQATMAHGQTGTIMQAQLPVTLAKNEQLAKQLGQAQQDFVAKTAQVCINCHLPVGAALVDDPLTVLPLDEGTASNKAPFPDGGEAVVKDGISCTFCHTLAEPLGELAGAGRVDVPAGTRDDFGTVYGPLFRDPNPLPVRVHDIGEGEQTRDGKFWDDPVVTSLACGACHNVKVDLDGDGLSPSLDSDTADDDGDRQLNGNEIDNQDGTLDDLVLQTTFDEWQDYVKSYDVAIAPKTTVSRALGCIECHMPSEPDAATKPVVDKAPGVLAVPDRPFRKHSFVGVEYDLDPTVYERSGLPASVVNDILAEREALLKSAITLQVDDAVPSADGQTQTANVVVANNLMGHTFPTGFAFARQFWLEVHATGPDGKEVCLVNPFAAQGVQGPCGSGVLAARGDRVPQCDPASVAQVTGVNDPAVLANAAIKFADAAPVGQCDPWLANFQKILTDGDPNQTGVFTEVAYQSFLPDIVKVRERVIDKLKMNPLQSVRLVPDATGALQEFTSLAIPYTFQAPAGTPLKVTATMHFRHLPPEFIRGLAKEQEFLDNVTDSARIGDPEPLVKNLVVTDIVTASTGQGAVLACEGPQNSSTATILECVKPVSGNGAVDASGFNPHAGLAAERSHPVATAAVVGGFTMMGGLVGIGRRPRRARR